MGQQNFGSCVNSASAATVMRLSQRNNLLVEQSFPTELLARNEWAV
ncbi:hypothetical protein ALQ65_04472 [Pseudomonas syringae pv. coriandricola]|uniref:Uncharacterized protein n=1 Tax=Pseudomonas syringae pv. coriandricola TaxID=264453 RepID=A0A0P9QQ81_9PSED|nr:hypothetical protein ALO76_05391 [Pseudomonas syringae pv. coriandricola]RMN11911.1 hypothetical protein ALQ65_04472 [Pseudomonas syringae pv. coriandricola]